MTHDITPSAVVPFPVDLRTTIRSRVREAIEIVLQEELEEALGAAGLSVVDRLGSFEGAAFEPDSPRLILVARKD